VPPGPPAPQNRPRPSSTDQSEPPRPSLARPPYHELALEPPPRRLWLAGPRNCRAPRPPPLIWFRSLPLHQLYARLPLWTIPIRLCSPLYPRRPGRTPRATALPQILCAPPKVALRGTAQDVPRVLSASNRTRPPTPRADRQHRRSRHCPRPARKRPDGESSPALKAPAVSAPLSRADATTKPVPVEAQRGNQPPPDPAGGPLPGRYARPPTVFLWFLGPGVRRCLVLSSQRRKQESRATRGVGVAIVFSTIRKITPVGGIPLRPQKVSWFCRLGPTLYPNRGPDPPRSVPKNVQGRWLTGISPPWTI